MWGYFREQDRHSLFFERMCSKICHPFRKPLEGICGEKEGQHILWVGTNQCDYYKAGFARRRARGHDESGAVAQVKVGAKGAPEFGNAEKEHTGDGDETPLQQRCGRNTGNAEINKMCPIQLREGMGLVSRV